MGILLGTQKFRILARKRNISTKRYIFNFSKSAILGSTFYHGIKPFPNDLRRLPYLGGGYFDFQNFLPPAAGGLRPLDIPCNVVW